MLQRISYSLHRRFLSGLLRAKHYPLRRVLLPLVLLQIIIIAFVWSNSSQRIAADPDIGYLQSNDNDDSSWYGRMASSFALKNNREIQIAKKLYENLKFSTQPRWASEYTLQNDLLMVKVGPQKGTKLSSVEDLKFYDFDPRLTWSVVLNHLENENENENEHGKLPFSWYDWTS